MRRKQLLLLALAVVLFGVALLALGAYRMLAPVKSPVSGEELGTSVSILDGHSQAFLIHAGRRAGILIDAGRDPEAKAIRKTLLDRNMGPDGVRAVLITHGHPDHIGGVGMFKGAEIYAHPAEVDLIAGTARADSPASRLIPTTPPTARVTHPVQDGQVLQIGDKQVEVFHLPGHTRGSVAYLIDGVLYLGDSALGGKEGEVLPSPWFFSDDTEENRRSLVKLAERLQGKDVRGLAFSHSAAIQDPQALQRLAAALRQ